MDKPAFIVSLVCLCCSAICTTAIVDKVIFHPLINDNMVEEDFLRSIKSHSIFFIIDGICAIIMLIIYNNTIIPFVILFVLWILSGFAYYHNDKIVYEMASLDVHNILRKTNIIRATLSFARFVSLFGFCLNELYRDN